MYYKQDWVTQREHLLESTVRKAASRGVSALLARALSDKDAKELLKTSTHMFKMHRLSSIEQAALLITDYRTFKKHIDPSLFDHDTQVMLFLSNTRRYESYVNFDMLSKYDMRVILIKRPAYVTKLSLSVRKKFPDLFWGAMLKRDFEANSQEFLDNIGQVRIKTDLRRIFKTYPCLISMLTPTQVEEMCLSPKDLLLLITSGEMKKHKAKLSEPVFRAVEKNLLVTVLKGSDTQSARLRNALALYK